MLQITFEAEAPRGYTFIPAGNPLLTTQCKELARQDGCRVYIVSVGDNDERGDNMLMMTNSDNRPKELDEDFPSDPSYRIPFP